MRGEKATAIQFHNLALSLLRRACGRTRRLSSLKVRGVARLHSHAFPPAQMRGLRFATKWREDVMEPQCGAGLEDTRNGESKTLNKGF